MFCGNIVDILPLAQSTVSNHLLELKKANLVNISSVGKSSFYSIQKDKLDFLHQFITNYIDSFNVNTHRTTDENKKIFEKDIYTTSKNSVAKNSKVSSNLKQYNYKFKHKK